MVEKQTAKKMLKQAWSCGDETAARLKEPYDIKNPNQFLYCRRNLNNCSSFVQKNGYLLYRYPSVNWGISILLSLVLPDLEALSNIFGQFLLLLLPAIRLPSGTCSLSPDNYN